MEIKGILIDTNAYAAFKQGKSEALEVLQHAPVIGVSCVVLGELLGGFALGNREKINREELKLFLNTHRVKVLFTDEVTVENYARIYHQLRRKGQPIPTNDMWIAANALQYGMAIFSYDNHFKVVQGLKVGACLKELYF